MAVLDKMHSEGLTDGLPVVPPTRSLVSTMVSACGYDPDEEVGPIAPSNTVATIQDLAVNAVMAGCRPAYLPVIVAAVRAMIEEKFCLQGVACSTKGCAPLLIVNGPMRREIGVATGVSLFGPGAQANATIGRAIRLILHNLGDARPGLFDKATLGHPGKFSYCIGEDEEDSPWQPLHVTRGLAPEQSAVTVFAGEAPRTVNMSRGGAEAILFATAQTIACVGIYHGNELTGQQQYTVVFAREHRQLLHAAGYTRGRIQERLCEQAVVPAAHRRRLGMPDAGDLQAVREPDDILVLAGGAAAGYFSAVIPGWSSMSKAVTKPILPGRQ